MPGDYSRIRFQPGKHFSGVLAQQGRVQLDADWNEADAIRRHQLRVLVRDLVGPAAFAGDGFAVSADRDEGLTAAAGHAWIDGLLAELEDDVELDPPRADLPLGPGTYLVYVEAWEREVTAVEDPTLRDVALGGPDTTARLATVTHVRLCPTAKGDLRRRTQLAALPPSTDATLAVRGAYRGLENRLYRIEVHDDEDAPTFKWSRENGSVAAGLKTWSPRRLVLDRDDAPFAPGDALEVVDRLAILARRPGTFVEAARVDGNRVSLTARSQRLPDDLVDPIVRRWDAWPVPVRGEGDGWLGLEDGVEVRLDGSTWRSGDHWLISARTADASLTWPDATDAATGLPRPPHGVEVVRAPIAVVSRSKAGWTLLRDLRRRLPGATK